MVRAGGGAVVVRDDFDAPLRFGLCAERLLLRGVAVFASDFVGVAITISSSLHVVVWCSVGVPGYGLTKRTRFMNRLRWPR
ncbi:hypothetical protein EAH80_28640 [Mycobacterium hodleri]|uniref:Uncharacterized protein n=1 Tax=Mycolicibacterium hodleri TaxID=49897 RepID=A0A502DRT7_9MYCO|nr:hypothetical protein EAH80_28640 [Mycolicibacterium hodleri]